MEMKKARSSEDLWSELRVLETLLAETCNFKVIEERGECASLRAAVLLGLAPSRTHSTNTFFFCVSMNLKLATVGE